MDLILPISSNSGTPYTSQFAYHYTDGEDQDSHDRIYLSCQTENVI